MIKRTFWLLLGLSSLVLGIVGVFLPLLPTTPFVLVSAYCFSRSSKRLHLWLLEHRLFGPLIKDWQEFGVIRYKTKCIATLTMCLFVSYPLIFLNFAWWLKLIVIVTILSVMAFIWTRPSHAPIEANV